MRDMVALERKGTPTVTISEDAFENAARNGAKMLGMPSLPLVVVPRSHSGERPEDLRQKVDSVFGALVSSVVQPR